LPAPVDDQAGASATQDCELLAEFADDAPTFFQRHPGTDRDRGARIADFDVGVPTGAERDLCPQRIQFVALDMAGVGAKDDQRAVDAACPVSALSVCFNEFFRSARQGKAGSACRSSQRVTRQWRAMTSRVAA
jgi:hypothetical protein